MRYHGEYEVDPSFINKDGRIKWRLTGNGEYILGRKGGKTFFIKRNIHVRKPAGGEPKLVREKYKAEADALEKKQNRLKKLMAGLSWDKDFVVVEEENFWDDEKMFVTVTACVPDCLPDGYDYTILGKDEFLSLAIALSTALKKIHERGVIHGDLKEKNILIAKNGGKYEPYLIDFDSSYAVDEIPAWDGIGGTEGYLSPEVLLYGSDEGASSASTITTAIDVFTYGIILHRWWTGAFPDIEMENASVGAAVYLGEKVSFDKKFDVVIGEEYQESISSLLKWTLAKDPAERPTAAQIVDVLQDKLEVPDKYQEGEAAARFDKELWTVHNSVAELYTVATLKKKGVKSFKRANEGSGSTGLKYHVCFKDGTEKRLSVEELILDGYARRHKALLEEPWPEHMIEFVERDEISAKGYAGIKKADIPYKKRYLVTTNAGRTLDKSVEWLLSEGLAKPVTVVYKGETPWPEHGLEYDAQSMARLGVRSIGRVDVCGEHRYKIVYEERIDGKRKVNDKVPVNNMRLMGFIK